MNQYIFQNVEEVNRVLDNARQYARDGHHKDASNLRCQILENVIYEKGRETGENLGERFCNALREVLGKSVGTDITEDGELLIVVKNFTDERRAEIETVLRKNNIHFSSTPHKQDLYIMIDPAQPKFLDNLKEMLFRKRVPFNGEEELTNARAEITKKVIADIDRELFGITNHQKFTESGKPGRG